MWQQGNLTIDRAAASAMPAGRDHSDAFCRSITARPPARGDKNAAAGIGADIPVGLRGQRARVCALPGLSSPTPP
jgi:hypothetical protein